MCRVEQQTYFTTLHYTLPTKKQQQQYQEEEKEGGRAHNFILYFLFLFIFIIKDTERKKKIVLYVTQIALIIKTSKVDKKSRISCVRSRLRRRSGGEETQNRTHNSYTQIHSTQRQIFPMRLKREETFKAKQKKKKSSK